MTQTLPTAAPPDVSKLVQQQRTHFASGATLSIESRRNALARLRATLIAHEDRLLAALHTDLRKPPQEAYAAEIGLVLSEIDYALKHLKRWMRPRKRSTPWMIFPAKARTVTRPFGCCLILGPWNYPVQLLILPLIGTIAGGNCAVVKPSELTPHTSTEIASIIESSFPPQHVACVEGDVSVARSLLEHRFDKIFFTGGTAAGRAVATAAAAHLTPVTLELGGKCPVIVCNDANIPVAARRIVWAKTMNAGQTCVAPDYLLVHSSVREPLIDAMTAQIRQMFGDNVQQSPHYGRIVNERHFDRLRTYLTQGTITTGGQHNRDDLFIAPTILQNVPPDADVMTEEIFGPILPVIPFDSLDQAIALIRTRPSPLAAYIFTTDRTNLRAVERQVPCGAICRNDLVVQLFGTSLPFGGVGESGNGRYRGKASFDCFTYEQSVVESSTKFDPPFRYQPPILSLSRFKKALPWFLRG